MRLYVDTADLGAIAEFLDTGLFAGVTCNPVILQAGGFGPDTASEFLRACREAGAREVFLQSFGRTTDAIVRQGLRYRALGPEIVVKVVGTRVGAAAVAELRRHDVPVLMTAVHSTKQVITAMAANATYVTPYLSEMNAAGQDGLSQLLTMHQILRASSSDTQLVLAGVTDTHTLVRCAQEGVSFATLSPLIAAQLLEDSLTERMETMFNQTCGL